MTKNYRDYREVHKELEPKENYTVEGYCALWEPYILLEVDNVPYYEQIHKEALDEADMSDIIFQLNHEGRVYARQSNNTLRVTTDNKGIYIKADLSSTEASRSIYEDIEKGLLNKQSWAFTVAEEYFDKETRTRHITKIKKVYDCSVVALASNTDTNIKISDKEERSRANYIDGVINKEKTEKNERARVEAEYIYLLKLNQMKGSI